MYVIIKKIKLNHHNYFFYYIIDYYLYLINVMFAIYSWYLTMYCCDFSRFGRLHKHKFNGWGRGSKMTTVTLRMVEGECVWFWYVSYITGIEPQGVSYCPTRGHRPGRTASADQQFICDRTGDLRGGVPQWFQFDLLRVVLEISESGKGQTTTGHPGNQRHVD